MQYNEIGKTVMRVSNLRFDASSLGGVFHGIREKEAVEAVHVRRTELASGTARAEGRMRYGCQTLRAERLSYRQARHIVLHKP